MTITAEWIEKKRKFYASLPDLDVSLCQSELAIQHEVLDRQLFEIRQSGERRESYNSLVTQQKILRVERNLVYQEATKRKEIALSKKPDNLKEDIKRKDVALERVKSQAGKEYQEKRVMMCFIRLLLIEIATDNGDEYLQDVLQDLLVNGSDLKEMMKRENFTPEESIESLINMLRSWLKVKTA